MSEPTIQTVPMSSDIKSSSPEQHSTASLVQELQAWVRRHEEPWDEWEIEMAHDVPQEAIAYMAGEPR